MRAIRSSNVRTALYLLGSDDDDNMSKQRGGVIDGHTLWVQRKDGDDILVEDPTLEELGVELEGDDGDTELQFRIKQSEYDKGANVILSHCLLRQGGGAWEVKNLGTNLCIKTLFSLLYLIIYHLI